MADVEFTPSPRTIIVSGNKWEEVGEWLSTSTNDSFLQTKLRWIEAIQITAKQTANIAVTVNKNSKSTSATEDDGGWFWVESSLIAGKNWRYKVIGLPG